MHKTFLVLDSVSTYVDENEINRLLYSFGYQGGLPELSRAKIGEPVGGGYVSYFGIVAPLYLKLTVQYEPGYVKVFVRYPKASLQTI